MQVIQDGGHERGITGGDGTSTMGKFVKQEQLLGQRGINLIERMVLEMGYAWNPTVAATDAGIDGYIELRNRQTGEMAAQVLLVQSKARTLLEAETADTFEFTPKPKDLEYWLQSNAPLLLIVSRPSTGEAWWVEIRRYVREQGGAKVRKVCFHKTRDKFLSSSSGDILQVVREIQPGLYFAPPRIRESLFSNLLEVKSLPACFYMAETDYVHPAALRDAMVQAYGGGPREWILRDKRVYSIHDLREGHWPEFCDRGTVERIETSEWCDSSDPETKRKVVQLLNACLNVLLGFHSIRFRRSLRCYYVEATEDLSPRVFAYQSREKLTTRKVFLRLANKLDPTRHYFRHSAFEGQFRRIDGKWYLEIEPGYVFTTDGMLEHPRHAERKSALRRLEGHAAVFGQVLMYARVLSSKPGMFQRYPHLEFGDLGRVEVDCGILDKVWASSGWDDSPDESEDASPEDMNEDEARLLPFYQ